jgi:intraflagellar transport protein 140
VSLTFRAEHVGKSPCTAADPTLPYCCRRAYNLDSELMRYAVKSTPALMIECAMHFEARGEADKAVQLYHKGGDIPRALDLCFRAGEDPNNPQAAVVFDMLNTIAQDLGADSSPQTLARCAEFLVQHKQYDKAVELLVMAKRYHSAVEMCLQNKVRGEADNPSSGCTFHG